MPRQLRQGFRLICSNGINECKIQKTNLIATNTTAKKVAVFVAFSFYT